MRERKWRKKGKKRRIGHVWKRRERGYKVKIERRVVR